jgi:tetratricopeptide (TPR) repeat protein
MYGGLDRQSVPELKTADDWFVANTAAKFGGREQAAAAWVEQGFRLFKEDDVYTAMQRFNEAWLLDPKNAEVYWGFGCVLNERGKAFDAYDMLKRAYDLGLRDSGFVADLGRVALMRIVERKDLNPQQRQQFIGESERFYAEAVKSENNLAYVYESWAFSRCAQEDYAGAWEKVGEARKQGGVVSPRLIEMLEEKGGQRGANIERPTSNVQH